MPTADAYTGIGAAEVVFGVAGHVLSLVADEQVQALQGEDVVLDARDTVTLTWLGAVPRPVAPASPLWAEATGTQAQDQLTVWVGDMAGDDLLAGVASFSSGDDSGELMWRGTAALALDATATQRLAAQVVEPLATHAQRELGLDLLAHTASEHSQTALIEALSDPQLASSSGYPAYVQRVGFVRAPYDATVAWVHEAIGSDAPSTCRAALATLGAVARGLIRSGRRSAVDGALPPLRESISDPADRAAALIGLGNAAQPQDLDSIVRATTSTSTDVRVAAVHALRAYTDEQASEALREAMADSAGVVQRAAWSGALSAVSARSTGSPPATSSWPTVSTPRTSRSPSPSSQTMPTPSTAPKP